MVFLQLLKKQYNLPVQTKQILQNVLVMSRSDIVLFYEDHVQLWNLDIQKCMNRSDVISNIFYWDIPIPIGKTSFAFISLDDQRSLQAYDFKGNKIKKIFTFQQKYKYFNIQAMFYFKSTQHIGFEAQANNGRYLLVWNKIDLLQIKLNEKSSLQKYNDDSLVIMSSSQNQINFQIFNGIQYKKYALKTVGQKLEHVKQFSQFEVALGLIRNGRTSRVCIYNLKHETTSMTQQISFPIDNILKVAQNNWVAMCTTEEGDISIIKVQRIFGKQQDKLYKQQNINFWLRYWNQYFPILTVAHDHQLQNKQLCGIQTIRCPTKKSLYVKALEASDIISNFGSDIVQQALRYLKTE